MKREILGKNKNNTAKIFTIVFFLFILILIIRLSYLCLTGKVDGIDLKSFAKNRNTKEETLYALRGNIYDINGDVLAQTINSYTIIAYLDEKRSAESKKPLHVVDKELTAEKLSTVLDMSKEKILERLNKDAYQVEFGTKGRGLTELQKEAIENLKYEIARELGIKLGADTSSRLNGTVGGEMTKRLVKLGEEYLNSRNI